MPATKPSFGTIGDEAFFWAHRTVLKHFFAPAANCSPHQDSMDQHSIEPRDVDFGNLARRHLFWMNSTPKARLNTGDMLSDRLYATMRIDKELGIISGDLHRDIKRKDWLLSFQSQTIFTLDSPNGETAEGGWNLIAVCEVHNANETGRSQSVVTVALRHNETDGLGAVRIHHAAVDGRAILDLSRTDEKRWTKDTYRYLKPIHLIDNEGFDDPYMKAIVEAAVGTKTDNIGQAFNGAGTEIFWDLKESPKTSETEAHEASSDSPFELTRAGDSTPFELISAYQWSDDPYQYAILFSSADERTFGTVLELGNELAPLAKVRFGAIVFLKPIINRAKELRRDGDAEAQFSEIVAFVRQTYIHEVGHLMNLAHTWQRSWFNTPSMRGNPADKSVMAYGSRFPLGNFMKASRWWQTNGAKKEMQALAKADADLARGHGLTDLKFTNDEARWLRHAPFDQVSPGGPYFTSRGENELKLGPESEKDDFCFSLNLWDTEVETKEGSLTEVHMLANYARSPFNRQALFGEVVLKVRPEAAERFPFHFAFQAPTLSLLMRVDVQDEDDDHRARTVKEINAVQLPTNWKINRDGKKEDANLAQNFHESAVLPTATITENGKDYLVFRRRLPFFHVDHFINDNFEKYIDPVTLEGTDLIKFTVQAVLRPVGSTVDVYSTPIPIRFVDRGKRYTKSEAKILNHPELPRFMEAFSYLDDSFGISQLEALHRHNSNRSDPVFEDLAEMIRNLSDKGTMSPETINYLFMLEATSGLDNKSRTRTPAFEITDTLRPILKQHLQREPDVLQAVFDRFTNIR